MTCTRCGNPYSIESKLVGGWCCVLCSVCLNEWYSHLQSNAAYFKLQHIERDIRATEIAAQCNDSVAADVYSKHMQLSEEKQVCLEKLFDVGRKFCDPQ